MFNRLDALTGLTFLKVPFTVSTDGYSDYLDLSGIEGTVMLSIAVAGSGSGTIGFDVVECDTSGGTYTAITADALFDPATGDPDTFDDVSATATIQTLALNKDLCQRYIKVFFDAGTSHVVAVSAAYTHKYANFSQS